MKLSREEVFHIALLARLGLSEEEIERFREQLSNILENFEVLKQVDTEGVPPTAQAIPLADVMAEDEVRPSFTLEQVLSNAPLKEEGWFRVRAVFE